MADIATLGLEVRSDQVEKGTRALDKMSGAAKRAEAAVNGFSSTSSGAASAASRLAAGTNNAEAGLERVAGAARQAQQSLRLASAAANDNIKAASKFNTANIAAQFQDIAVSAQMGMGAFQIGLQQGTQLAAVISMMENPLRGLGAAFMSVISPVSLLTIGLVSLSAAGLQMVDWPKRTAQALIFLADNLKAIAPYAATAAAALALIYAPSVIAGMVNLIAWMGRVSVAAVSMGASFALANPVTALVAGFAAAVIAANIFRDELTRIFGLDIVGAAKSGVNAIIGVFVGSYNAIVKGWSALPGAFADLSIQVANNFLGGIQYMVRETVSLVNGMIISINGSLRNGFEALGMDREAAPQFPDLGPLRNYKISQIENPYAGQAQAFDKGVLKSIQDAQKTDYVGNTYSAIESGASAAAGKLRELAKGLTDVDDKSKKGRKRRGKTDAEYYQDIIDGADRRIASLLVEQQALGMTEEAANALRYEQEMLNQAQQHGIELTPKQADYIKMLAGTMAGLESAIQKAQDAINFAKVTTKGFFSDMANGLANGRGLWGSLADAAVNAITKIADALIDSGIDSLFGGSGFGSLLGELFGGKSADPWSGLRLASGGYVSGPGSATSDSIPAWLSNGEFVMNAQATKAFGPWLQAMNDNKLRGFAYGGPVDGNVVSMPSRSTLPSVREAAVSGGRQTVRVITETRFVNDGNFQNYIKGEVEEGSAKTFKAGIQKYDKGGAVRAARDLRQVNQRGYAK
ncbi:phage tail length tape measure family protein [Ochrobactrum sp. WV_118_8]|uniref:phage tail length tape measure family protein n=1 Tax=Brucella anthropi TaxID=529 RepID=UPI0021583309|nr:phage tail length tape measure family protein [Brucella anthropi]MCR8490946.1 phage tail length tape measure family protein [Brucella anthropi]